MPDIRDRFIRNEAPVIEPGPRPDAVHEVPNARRSFYRPALPDSADIDDNLKNAHASVDSLTGIIRGKVAQVWETEPSIPGVSLTAKQRHEAKKARVAETVRSELEGGLKLVRPVIDRAQKELESAGEPS